MDQAIADSLNCYRICVETLTYCIKKGGKHAELQKLVLKCVENVLNPADRWKKKWQHSSILVRQES